MVPKGKRIAKHTSRHGGRVVLSLDVEPRVRDALRERAAASGVSMAEYLANALAMPERLHATASAKQAEILAVVSYHVARAQDAASKPGIAAVTSELQAVQKVIAQALRPLARSHADELRSTDRRRAGGWSG